MMVIYLPVKFEFDWIQHFRVTSPETEILTDRQIDKTQTNGQNYTNFERNLAMMVIYLHVKFEFDWTVFLSWSLKTEMLMDKQTKTDKRTDESTPISKGT